MEAEFPALKANARWMTRKKAAEEAAIEICRLHAEFMLPDGPAAAGLLPTSAACQLRKDRQIVGSRNLVRHPAEIRCPPSVAGRGEPLLTLLHQLTPAWPRR